MHIAINCLCFLKKHPTGIGRYATNLIKSLMEIDKEDQYSLYVPKALFDSKRSVPKLRTPKNFSIKVDWLKRGPEKTLRKLDIYHSPCPDIINFTHIPSVVTIHDVVYKAFPSGHTEETLKITDEQCRSFMKHAAKLICVSQNTANDVKKYFGVSDDRLKVIYNGTDHHVFYPIPNDKRDEARECIRAKGVTEPFILFIGTIEPRKNLKNLFEAFSILKDQKKFKGKLVVIGMAGWKSEGLLEHVKKLGIENDLITLGYMTNDELRYFYNLAEVFVFPSFYEGFGYPIVEAFSCGVAVVTSNSSSCPEIAGGAALIVDPHSPFDIAEKTALILEDKRIKNELIQKGFLRAKEFDYSKTAQQTLAVYKEVYSKQVK